MAYNMVDEAPPQLNIAKILQNHVQILDRLITNITIYHEVVKQSVKSLASKGQIVDKVEQHVFVGRFSHNETLQSILDCVEFLIFNSEQEICLGVANI